MNPLYNFVNEEMDRLEYYSFLSVLIAITQQKENTVKINSVKKELKTLCYLYLKKNFISTDEAKLFIKVLSLQDIETLKEIHSYNYNKLKIVWPKYQQEQS